MQLNFIPIKTRILNPPKDEIWDIVDNLEVQNGDIIFITSKILAIHQGRCVSTENADKKALIQQEAEHYLSYKNIGGYEGCLTITDNILIPSAGIDESNANNHYILWPKNVDVLCREIRDKICKRCKITELGIISTDSHTMPLRLGVTGITTGFAGIKPLRDIRGDEDIFGREIKTVQVNLIDPLTSVAVLLMGETSERIPIVILRGYKNIVFDESTSMEDLIIEPERDIYKPLLECFKK